MDDETKEILAIYELQVLLQIMFALKAHERLTRGIAAYSIQGFPPERFFDRQVELWGAVQDFLGASGNVAKAFWGASGKKEDDPIRGALRERYETDDSSPLKDVSMRNNFEHFDERIDRWWAKSTTRNYHDLAMAPNIRVETSGDNLDIFRTLDSATLKLTFWGEPFELAAIERELQRLLAIFRRRNNYPAV
jgi:hypothetical protein